MSKKIKIILTLSLILNALFLGIWGGMAYKNAMFFAEDWNELKEQLAPETRALMKETLFKKRAKILGVIREVRAYKGNLEEIMGAELFDPDAFDVSAKTYIEFNHKMSIDKLNVMKTLALQLPQAERQKLAKRFIDVLSGPRKEVRKSHGHQGQYGPVQNPEALPSGAEKEKQ